MQPTIHFDPVLLLKAQGIRVAFFDVDGVLTDGGLLFSESGETLKRFNTLDGHGLKMIQKIGITPVVITGRDSKPLRARLAALGITHAHFGTEDKLPAAEQTLKALGMGWEVAAAMGDDWPDLPVMRRSAFACAPVTCSNLSGVPVIMSNTDSSLATLPFRIGLKNALAPEVVAVTS